MLDIVSEAKQASAPETFLRNRPARRDIFLAYEHAKTAAAVLDLDDLIAKTLSLLRANEDLRRRVADRFLMVCVDEYQDLNDAQAALLTLLWPDGTNLTAIGDPDQAIYGFRGSRPEHFHRFSSTFPKTTIIRLRNTYRLTRELAHGASGLLGHETPPRTIKSGPRIEVVSTPTPRSEAEQLVVRIEQLMGGTSHFSINTARSSGHAEASVGFGDIAILVRMRAQRGPILEALQRASIPCLQIGEDEPHDPRAQKVSVMTMHASKGREFGAIFILGLEEGLMPMALDGFDTDAEEERRLLYVAMTRAKHVLVLSHAGRRTLFGQRLSGRPSPLLAELPEGALVHRSSLAGSGKTRQLSLF